MSSPVKPSERILGLDVLRGFSILGILVVNIEQLLLPPFLAGDPVAVRPDEFGTYLAWLVTDVLFESKFLTVFPLLFGAGFCLQMLRSGPDTRPFRTMYLRRSAILIAFGLFHGAILYFADVLVVYGLAALPLLWLRDKSGPRMIRLGALMLIPVTVIHILGKGPGDPERARRQQTLVSELAAFERHGTIALDGQQFTRPVPGAVLVPHLQGNRHDPEEAKAQVLAFGHGPQSAALRARIALFLKYLLVFTPFYLLWRTLALFLIAAGLVKLGVLEVRRQPWWRRAALIGFGLGLPLSIAASAIKIATHQSQSALVYANVFLQDISALLLAGGISALTLLLCARTPLGRLGRLVSEALAGVGRLALTNYIAPVGRRGLCREPHRIGTVLPAHPAADARPVHSHFRGPTARQLALATTLPHGPA